MGAMSGGGGVGVFLPGGSKEGVKVSQSVEV